MGGGPLARFALALGLRIHRSGKERQRQTEYKKRLHHNLRGETSH